MSVVHDMMEYFTKLNHVNSHEIYNYKLGRTFGTIHRDSKVDDKLGLSCAKILGLTFFGFLCIFAVQKYFF